MTKVDETNNENLSIKDFNTLNEICDSLDQDTNDLIANLEDVLKSKRVRLGIRSVVIDVMHSLINNICVLSEIFKIPINWSALDNKDDKDDEMITRENTNVYESDENKTLKEQFEEFKKFRNSQK